MKMKKKKRQMKMERNPIFTFSRADTFGYGGTQTHFVAGEEKVAVLFLLETSRHRQTGRRTGLGKNHSGACLSVFSPLLSLMTRWQRWRTYTHTVRVYSSQSLARLVILKCNDRWVGVAPTTLSHPTCFNLYIWWSNRYFEFPAAVRPSSL